MVRGQVCFVTCLIGLGNNGLSLWKVHVPSKLTSSLIRRIGKLGKGESRRKRRIAMSSTLQILLDFINQTLVEFIIEKTKGSEKGALNGW